MSPYVSHDQCNVCVLTLLDGQLHGHPCAVCHGVVDSTDVSVCVSVCLLTAWSKNVQIAHRRGSISIV